MTLTRSVAFLRLFPEQKTQGKAKVKYKLTSLKVLFVYNRYNVKLDHQDFIEFFHIETAKSLMVIDTTDNVQMFVILSCDVSYSTREAAKEGQAKDNSRKSLTFIITINAPASCYVMVIAFVSSLA